MFSFPSDDETRKKWLSIVKQFRRKGGHDNFTIEKKQKYVSFILTSAASELVMAQAKKSLISGSIPTIFKFKKQKETSKQKSQKNEMLLKVI